MQPVTKNRPPSFWRGLAALDYPFEDTADYSRWACMLLERGYEEDSICVLAGMEDEVNVFVLREWLQKAILDLRVTLLDESDALAAYARSIMEDFLIGHLSLRELFEIISNLYLETHDDRLYPLTELSYAWYEFEYADWGIKNITEISVRSKSECLAFIKKHQAQQANNPILQRFAFDSINHDPGRDLRN